MKELKLFMLFAISVITLNSCNKKEDIEDKETKISYKIDGTVFEFSYGIEDSVWVNGTIHTLSETNTNPVGLFDLYVNKSIEKGNYTNDIDSSDDDPVYFTCEGNGFVLKPLNLNIKITKNDDLNDKIVGTINGTMIDLEGETHSITQGNFTLYYMD